MESNKISYYIYKPEKIQTLWEKTYGNFLIRASSLYRISFFTAISSIFFA